MRLSLGVVIATFNRPDLVTRAVESAWCQADQVIVVNDGSSLPYDKAAIVVNRPNVSYIALPENRGVQAARNAGLDAATTDLALILDDDDTLKDDAVARIKTVLLQTPEMDDYPVYNFATSNAGLDRAFAIVRHGDYLSRTLTGDFTPVFNLNHASKARYPVASLKVGIEHLLWLPVAETFGIPTWRDVIVVQVHTDAQVRLTSPATFIAKAEDFAVMQHMTACLMKQSGWNQSYPSAYKKRVLALLLYALVAGNTQLVEAAVKELPQPLRMVSSFTKLLPATCFRQILYWIKRIELRNSHRA